MFYWQPSKWVQYAVVAALPWGAASWLNTDSLVTDISTRAAAAAGDWAKVSLDGRDATITGSAPSQAEADSITGAIATTYGIRTVDVGGVKVVPPAPKAEAKPEPLAAPVITEAKIENNLPIITGTWPEGKAKSLDVTVGDRTYSLGKDPELTSSNGNWLLKLAAPLAAGAVVITAKDGDGAGAAVAAEKPVELKVEAPPAPKAVEAAPPPPPPEPLTAPVISEAKIVDNLPIITGTWPEGKAKTLEVTIDTHVYKLGTDPELTSSGGNWVLKPTAPLAAGAYSVTAKDGDGTTTMAAAEKPAELKVEAPPAPKVEALAAPTIEGLQASGDKATIIGSWPEGKAKTLDVTVNDKVYSLGASPELTSKDGNWTLKLAGLAAGAYTISASDGNGDQTAKAAKDIKLDVAAPPPPPPPKPLTVATVDAIKVEPDKPVTITGTWAVGVATGLSVAVNDKTSVLGKDFNLLTDTAGKWKLTEPADLAPGKYNVVVTETGADGKTVQTSGSFEIAAPPPPPPPKAAPPAAPTVEAAKSDSDHPTVKGTWPVAAGNSLQVELDGVTHTLGKDFDLLSDASGKWTLTPTKPVVNGTYDVVAKVTAADGQSSTDASKGELTVAVAPPAPAPAPEQPYDCESTLAKIAAVFPIRFEFDHADLGPKYQQALSQYAALLNDKRCAALKVQVAGNADYLGSEAYNMGLSENRAKTAVDALTAAKVDAGRLSSIGNGTSKPLDPAHSDDARAKNRRVEFSVVK